MKKIYFLLLLSILLINCTPTPGSQCGSGNNICADFQGTTYAFSNSIQSGSGYYYITGSGSNGIDLTVWTSGYSVSSYGVQNPSINGNHITIYIGSTIYRAYNGTIIINSISNHLLYGTFDGNMRLNTSDPDRPISGKIDGVHYD